MSTQVQLLPPGPLFVLSRQYSPRKLEITDPYNSTMLLTLTTTHNPATDLGFLLHKNPANLHSFDLSFGKAHVFYPESTAERCTAALLLDVDPIGLVRGKRGQHEGGTLDQYVNDRPYVLSSFLSVAMGRAFGTAMSGRSKGRQELADLPIPLTNLTGESLCRGLGSRWFTERLHRNALVTDFQHGQVFRAARHLKDYAVARCRLHQ